MGSDKPRGPRGWAGKGQAMSQGEGPEGPGEGQVPSSPDRSVPPSRLWMEVLAWLPHAPCHLVSREGVWGRWREQDPQVASVVPTRLGDS